jgi:multidrug efflux pump subunit AcrB
MVRGEAPAFTIKQMTVVTAWPGATAKEMEELVAEKLEKRMQELRWYDRTETFTRPGLAFTTVVLRDSTPPAAVPDEFYQARKKLGDEAAQLPRGVIGPMVNDEYSDVTFALYALKAKEPQRTGPRCGGLAPTTAARGGGEEGEHHRRAGGEDLRRVLL